MKNIEIHHTDIGFSLNGEIRFCNVLALREKGNQLIRQGSNAQIIVDLSGVSSTDTSALSLLLRWIHYARQQKKEVRYQSIPESLLNVAKVCGVFQLIGENSNG